MADEDDPYDCVATGGLRLKGGKIKKDKKKKRKKNKAKEIFEEATKSTDQQQTQSGNDSDDEDQGGEASGSNEQRQQNVSRKTAAELAFEKAQEKRAAERILDKASKTHKQRVEELNDYLGGLSEHYDIQKVSWTK